MTHVPMMRASALAVVLAASALLIQGCTVSDPTMTAQGTRLLGASGVAVGAANASPYSGDDWSAALDSAMTTDSGGE